MRIHWADCAVHNAPALPLGECNCGGLYLADNAAHNGIATAVSLAGRCGCFACNRETLGFVEPKELPACPLAADASASDLPDTHYRVAVFGKPCGVDFDDSGVPVISNF